MSGRPAGIPDDAVEMTVDQLVALAEKDPSMRGLAAQALAARDKVTAPTAAPPVAVPGSAPANRKKGPVAVVVQGKEVYRWEQNLDEVLIYVPRPPGVPAKAIDCRVTATRLYLAIRGNDRAYIDEELGGVADEDESLMAIEDGNIVVYIHKAQPGSVWASALAAHAALDAVQAADAKKALLLERFQREHPGFDFSNAQLTGEVPDAREFLGGIDHAAIRKNPR